MRTALVLVFLLAGCATRQESSPAHGNFIAHAPAAAHQKMADDAVRQLAVLYPPAQTQFTMAQSDDPFGRALQQTMRHQGYALGENRTTSLVPVPPSPGISIESATPSQSSGFTREVRLQYILDDLPGTNLVRLTLQVEDQLLTRAYQLAGEQATPASQWIRKE